MADATLVAVDWGTSRLRAYLVGTDGVVLARTHSDDGLLAIGPDGFEPALERALGALGEAAQGLPVLMSGMVGSKRGWIEARYVHTPASLDALGDGVIEVPAAIAPVYLVPGVAAGVDRPFGADVMRGEETEVFGALTRSGLSEGRFVLPGTHTKWVDVEDGAIVRFQTFMTGDLFAALTNHTVLAQTTGVPRDEKAFVSGVHRAAEAARPADLLGSLFLARTEGLFGRLDEDGAASFLSGLLMGAEIIGRGTADSVAILLGAEDMVRLYEIAFRALHMPCHRVAEPCAVPGLCAIAAARGLVAPTSSPPAPDKALAQKLAAIRAGAPL